MAAPADDAEREPLLTGGPSAAPSSSYQSTAAELRSPALPVHNDQLLAEEALQHVAAHETLASPRRRNSFDRQQFQAARQGALRDAALTSQSWRTPLGAFVFICLIILLLTPPVVIIYIEVRSWHAVFAYGDKKCDQDLLFWLIVRNVFFLLAPTMPAPGDPDQDRAERQRRAVHISSVLWLVWLIIGYTWTSSCKTCQDDNPDLYNWVRFVVIFSLLVHVLKICFPLLVLLCAMAYHSLVAHGWLKSPNAASEQAIEAMEKVEYREGFFGGSGPDAPPGDCCCCMDEFNKEKVIVRTPCGHYFHYECLKEWLKVAKTCPMCRQNLDVEPVASSSSAV